MNKKDIWQKKMKEKKNKQNKWLNVTVMKNKR